MSDNWIERARASDDPTQVIRETLEKSLNENNLRTFSHGLSELAKDEVYSHLLEPTPLELVPILLLANDTITAHPQCLQEIYELISRHGSPKEVLLVAQESFDKLSQEAKELDNDEESATLTPSQIIWKWLRLIDMYTLAFPRLVPRKRSAPDTATPIVQHLRDSFRSLGQLVDPNEPVCQELVEACMRLGYALLGWFDGVGSKPYETIDCKTALEQLLSVAIAECLSDRHIMQDHNDFLYRLRAAGLAFTPAHPTQPTKMTIHTRSQSIGALILYYLSNRGPIRPKGTRQAVKAQLSALSVALHRPRWRQTALGAINDCVLGGLYDEDFLEEDVAAELIPMVSTPASTDPDPKNRAVLFNLLTRMILQVQPVHAFKFVRDLASEECPYLNMRSSAVGLLRRLVVRAFSQDPPSKDDPFASRLLLEEYKAILLQSPVLEEIDLEGSKSADAQEINRLVEVLGFFYVLLARDNKNLSGVRDLETVQELKDKLVNPLKKLVNEVDAVRDDPSLFFSLGFSNKESSAIEALYALDLDLVRSSIAVELMTDQAVDSIKPSPPPISPSSSAALSAALESATQCWQDELKILYSRAKSWYADVVWDAIDDDGQIEEVWGHKAIVWARAPSSLQAMYSVPQIISGSSSLSPAPDQQSELPADSQYISSSTNLISYSNDRLLRIPLTINPTLLASGLESLYTGQEVPVGFSLATPLQDQQTKGSESTMEVGRYEKLRKDMINIWRSRMFSDVQITLVGSFASNNGEVAQAIFSSHRFILAARVPYFRALLTKNLAPAGQNISSSNPLPLHLPAPPFTPPSLHFTLGFIYTGTMAFSHRNWDLDTAFGVVRAAIYLRIDTLANEARARIISEMMHGLFHAYLPFDEYERIIEGKWGTGGCKCKQCQRRAPRVLEFALGDDMRDNILERGATRAVVGMYGKGWATSEFLSLPLRLKNTLLKGVKNRVSPRNIIPLLLATEAGLNKLFSNSKSPAQAVKDLMLQARKKIDEVLCNNLCDVLEEPEWISLLESDAAGFGDMDKFDLVLASIRRGLAGQNAGQIYQ
ncbi:unnamed protein product [Rhizoctonia solani]|uniref:BTB domain-containing protein n=1 Tax=Rhizoctonia solani TaxID=456999 RepID=A0A8H2ZX70_9AGAM|nr:unnamed protein product [Rhizoctonia solani]